MRYLVMVNGIPYDGGTRAQAYQLKTMYQGFYPSAKITVKDSLA